jgi:hypothetical protein
MRVNEERAFERRRADTERLYAGARALRQAAVQAGYAGFRGTYVGITLASLIENVARSLDQMPAHIRSDALRVVDHLLDGADGPNDPRTANNSALSDGPGH